MITLLVLIINWNRFPAFQALINKGDPELNGLKKRARSEPLKKTALLIIASFLAAIPSFGLAGCTLKVGESPQVIATGPPPHAPAHGYRAKHQYYYYPAINAYYAPVRGVYFYYSGGSWQVGVSLPASLSVKIGDRVSLELDTDKPYIYNGEHKAKYPPGQMKKNTAPGKGKGKKKW